MAVKRMEKKGAVAAEKQAISGIELCGGCQTYVTPRQEIYRAGTIYPAEGGKLRELMGYVDERGVPYFRLVTDRAITFTMEEAPKPASTKAPLEGEVPRVPRVDPPVEGDDGVEV